MSKIIHDRVNGIEESSIDEVENEFRLLFNAEVTAHDLFKTMMIATLHNHYVQYGDPEREKYDEVIIKPEQ